MKNNGNTALSFLQVNPPAHSIGETLVREMKLANVSPEELARQLGRSINIVLKVLNAEKGMPFTMAKRLESLGFGKKEELLIKDRLYQKSNAVVKQEDKYSELIKDAEMLNIIFNIVHPELKKYFSKDGWIANRATTQLEKYTEICKFLDNIELLKLFKDKSDKSLYTYLFEQVCKSILYLRVGQYQPINRELLAEKMFVLHCIPKKETSLLRGVYEELVKMSNISFKEDFPFRQSADIAMAAIHNVWTDTAVIILPSNTTKHPKWLLGASALLYHIEQRNIPITKPVKYYTYNDLTSLVIRRKEAKYIIPDGKMVWSSDYIHKSLNIPEEMASGIYFPANDKRKYIPNNIQSNDKQQETVMDVLLKNKKFSK